MTAPVRLGRFQPNRRSAEAWESLNPLLLMGEQGFQFPDEDYPQGRWKTGVGDRRWNELPYDDEPERINRASESGVAVLTGTPAQGRGALEAASTTDVTEVATAAKVGETWWNTVMDPPIADDTPSVLVSASSGIAGGTAVIPTPDYFGDPGFRYDGCADVTSGGVNLVAPVGPTAAGASYALVPEFVTSQGCDKVDIVVRTNSAGATIGLRVVINGRWLTVPLTWHAAAANSVRYIRLTFPTAKSRAISVHTTNVASFGGVVVPSGETVMRPAQEVRKRLVIVGDSYTKGSGSNTTSDPATNGTSQFETFAFYLAKLLGCDSVINLGVGGTGWMNNGGDKSTFGARIKDILDASPHIVLMAGSRNDNTYTGAQVFNAAVSALKQLSGVPIVEVMGLGDDGSTTGTAAATLNEAVKQAARAQSRPFRDMLGVVTPVDKNAADNVHPSVMGSQKLAKALYGSMDRARIDEAVAATVAGRTTSDLTLSTSPSSSVEIGGSVTLTATLSTPRAGKVSFYVDSTLLSTVTVADGIATYSTSALAVGSHTLTAQFLPSNPIIVKPVMSNPVTFTVDANLGFVDHFSVDVSPLASTENGKPYVAGGAASGGVASITGVASGTRYYVVEAGTPNGIYSVKLGGTITGAVIPLRYVDGSNLLRLSSQSGQIVLQQTVANNTSNLFTGSGGNWAAGDVISVEIAGDTFIVKKNGVGVPGLIGVTTSQFNTATKFGLGATSSGGALTYDDLEFVAA